MSLKETLVIIPTYNEIDNINKMLNTIFELYPEISVLIIDDASPDGTADIVKELQGKFHQLHLKERTGKLGLGTAYIEGFRFALKGHYQYIFEMDCDFSHDPKDIKVMLENCKENDLIIGSRYINGIRIINWPMRRLLLSYFAGIYTRIITGLNVLDATGGFKCFKRSTLEKLNLDKVFSNGYSFQIELNFKVYALGLKIKEVPIIFTERRDGQSKMSQGIVFEAIFAVIKLRLRKMFKRLN